MSNAIAIVLVLPFPPSMNSYWRHITKGKLAGRSLISEKGRNYRTLICQIMQFSTAGKIGSQRVRIDIEARMPDRRKRDLDNIPKAILDALTHAKFWDDDSQIDDMRIWRSEKFGGELVITVEPMQVRCVQPSLLTEQAV